MSADKIADVVSRPVDPARRLVDLGIDARTMGDDRVRRAAELLGRCIEAEREAVKTPRSRQARAKFERIASEMAHVVFVEGRVRELRTLAGDGSEDVQYAAVPRRLDDASSDATRWLAEMHLAFDEWLRRGGQPALRACAACFRPYYPDQGHDGVFCGDSCRRKVERYYNWTSVQSPQNSVDGSEASPWG